LYVKSLESASLSIMSLKISDIQVLKVLLNELCEGIRLEIKEKVLVKSQLRGMNHVENNDMLILQHRAEGRLLLTDRNGFYNDLLSTAFRVLEGRVLIVITNVENDPPEGALASSEIYELAKYGDQPTIGVLADMGKVVCYKTKPSGFQAQHIQNLLKKFAYFREVPNYDGLPDSFSPFNKTYKCPLL
jgi:hypothetical protein